MLAALEAANGAGSVVQLGNGTASKVGAGEANDVSEQLYARAWLCRYMYPEVDDSADNDTDHAAKGADGRMFDDIRRQITFFCAPATAAFIAMPPSENRFHWDS